MCLLRQREASGMVGATCPADIPPMVQYKGVWHTFSSIFPGWKVLESLSDSCGSIVRSIGDSIHMVQALPPLPGQSGTLASDAVKGWGVEAPAEFMSTENKLLIAQVIICRTLCLAAVGVPVLCDSLQDLLVPACQHSSSRSDDNVLVTRRGGGGGGAAAQQHCGRSLAKGQLTSRTKPNTPACLARSD